MLYLALAAVALILILLVSLGFKYLDFQKKVWYEQLIDKHISCVVVGLMGKAHSMKHNNPGHKLTEEEREFLSDMAIAIAAESVSYITNKDMTKDHSDIDLAARVSAAVNSAKINWQGAYAILNVEEKSDEEEEEDGEGEEWKG